MSGLRKRCKRLFFALLPAVVLFALAEGGLRLVLVFFPSWDVVVSGVEEVVEDRDLFWRLKANLETHFKLPPDAREGPVLRTNSRGMRDDEEVGPKAEGELRILSLGESTTYGALVAFDDTYGEVAERILNERERGRTGGGSGKPGFCRVINGAVPAYTSFQSLIYFEKYGQELDPGVVVLYHEGNDYLPCGWGDAAAPDETDPECYARRQRWRWAWSLGRLRLVSVPAYWLSRRGVDRATFGRAWGKFGNRVPGIKTRLNRAQQREVLERFHTLCRRRGMQLVLIHPTYRATVRHECVLTEFAREHHVPLMETFDLFPQRDGRPIPDAFIDQAHPTQASHRLIGEELAAFLMWQQWWPQR